MRAANDSNHLRERAVEMRASSKELKDNNTAALIMHLADLYDRLADRAETRRDSLKFCEIQSNALLRCAESHADSDQAA